MENKTEIKFMRNLRCAPTFTDSSAEYALPDYNGDVRKILYTGAEVRPSGKFASGDEVEYSGIVVYDVIYLDAENKLTSVTFTSDYDYSVKCSGENYHDSFAETSVANYAIRLIGPRKIAAKASVSGAVRLVETDSANIGGDAFEGDESPEIETRCYKIRKSLSSSGLEREYAESVARLDGAIADEVSVISSAADVVVEETLLGDGCVTVRGNLTLFALIKNGDMPAYQREKVISFEENLPFADAEEGMKFIPEVNVASLVATINAQEFGTEVVVSAVLDFYAIGEGNEDGEIVTDAYLKSCAVDNKYEDFSYSELSQVITSREAESGSVQRSEIEAEGIREILLLKGTPKIDSISCNDGKLTVAGDLKYNGVASVIDEEGAIGYVPLKFSLPFERSLEVDENSSISYDVHLKAHNATATFDAAKLYVTCNLEIVAAVCEDKHIKRLASSKALHDQPFEKNESRIVIYYPSEGEDLFSVAKKYRTTTAKIIADNMLTAEVMAAANGESTPVHAKKLLIY